MYLFEIDQSHNRMHIILAEHFTRDEARELLGKCIDRIGEVAPDYRILCDLTSLETFEHSAKLIYRRIMDLCNAAGVKKVIRVYADLMQTFGLNIMSAFHYNDTVEIVSTDSFTRARRHLE